MMRKHALSRDNECTGNISIMIASQLGIDQMCNQSDDIEQNDQIAAIKIIFLEMHVLALKTDCLFIIIGRFLLTKKKKDNFHE